MQEDKDSELSRNTRRSFGHTSNPMNEKFRASSIYSNKVEPTRYIEEHGNIKSTSMLPSISRSTRRLSPDLGNGFMYQPSRLPPLSNGNADAFRSVNETSPGEPQHRKKSKKRKSHKHKHRDISQSEEVRVARLHGTIDVRDDMRYANNDERRHSDTKERRHSGNNERKYSDSNERRHSDNDERRHSEKGERRHSKEKRKHRHSRKKSPDDYI